MKAFGVVAVVVGMAASASASPRPAGWAITRRDATAMPAAPTTADVEALLVGSAWYQHNPEKKTSTWSTRSYEFDKAGKVAQKGDLDTSARELAWKIVNAGKRPIIEIDGSRLALEACALPDKTETLCLFVTR